MKKFLPYVGAAFVLTVAFGTIGVAVQQAQRSEANYPQVQIAQDAARVLDGKASPDGMATTKVDMAHSLAPFTVLYDKSGKPVAGSGYLNGALPAIPKGVLTAADGKEYSSVTWGPQSGVRIAAVTVASDNFYVLSGRSLRYVEQHEATTFQLSIIGWALSIAALGLVFVTNSTPSTMGSAKLVKKTAKTRAKK